MDETDKDETIRALRVQVAELQGEVVRYKSYKAKGHAKYYEEHKDAVRAQQRRYYHEKKRRVAEAAAAAADT